MSDTRNASFIGHRKKRHKHVLRPATAFDVMPRFPRPTAFSPFWNMASNLHGLLSQMSFPPFNDLMIFSVTTRVRPPWSNGVAEKAYFGPSWPQVPPGEPCLTQKRWSSVESTSCGGSDCSSLWHLKELSGFVLHLEKHLAKRISQRRSTSQRLDVFVLILSRRRVNR